MRRKNLSSNQQHNQKNSKTTSLGQDGENKMCCRGYNIQNSWIIIGNREQKTYQTDTKCNSNTIFKG